MRQAIRAFFLDYTYEAAGCVNTNTLGLFLDDASAMAAAKNLADRPGFRDYPMGFCPREAVVYALEGEALFSGQKVHYAFCSSFHVDEEGVEYESVWQGVLYTEKETAEAELNEWRLGGFMDKQEEQEAGVDCWVIGRIAQGWEEGFEIYLW